MIVCPSVALLYLAGPASPVLVLFELLSLSQNFNISRPTISFPNHPFTAQKPQISTSQKLNLIFQFETNLAIFEFKGWFHKRFAPYAKQFTPYAELLVALNF